MVSSARRRISEREYAAQGLSVRISEAQLPDRNCPHPMNPYFIFKTVHLLTAVLGLGQVGALLLISRQLPSATPLIVRIARIVTVSLLLMLLSGIGLLKMSGWAFAPTVWVRGSFGLLLVIGFSASRMVKAARATAQTRETIAALRRHSTILAVLTGVIVWLMTVKPF